MKNVGFVLVLIISCVSTAFLTRQYMEAKEPITRAECYFKNSKDVLTEMAASMARVACDKTFPEPADRVNIFDQFEQPPNN